MSAERTATPSDSKAPTEHVSSWDGGWYVFEDGQIIGPLNAVETFSRPKLSTSGKVTMISRKGFTQWYPIEDFASIHKLAGKYSDHLGQSSEVVSAKASDPKKNFEPVAKKIGLESDEHKLAAQKISQAQQELSVAAVRTVETLDFAKTKNASQPAQTSPLKSSATQMSRKEKKRIAEEERRAKRFAARQDKVAKKAAKDQKLMPTVTFAQQYLQVSSRLRLGKINSPFLGSFLYIPLTVGFYWWAWIARTSEEVSWHLNGASRMNFLVPMWMCMVPGVHLVFAYLLARMTRQMEEQNGYRTINPALATFLALFPPFYIAMMQGALNRHWRLHVYHSAAK